MSRTIAEREGSWGGCTIDDRIALVTGHVVIVSPREQTVGAKFAEQFYICFLTVRSGQGGGLGGGLLFRLCLLSVLR